MKILITLLAVALAIGVQAATTTEVVIAGRTFKNVVGVTLTPNGDVRIITERGSHAFKSEEVPRDFLEAWGLDKAVADKLAEKVNQAKVNISVEKAPEDEAKRLERWFLSQQRESVVTKEVPGHISARYYNSIWRSWSDARIWIYIDNHSRVYLAGRVGKTGIMETRGAMWGGSIYDLKKALIKGVDWAKQAAQDGIETTKELWIDQESKTYLQFYSTKNGKEASLIVGITDFETGLTPAEYYLSPNEAMELTNLIDRIHETINAMIVDQEKAKKLK